MTAGPPDHPPSPGEASKADVNAVQQAASHPESSIWVEASAGSGKTHVLTRRVLRLLLAGSRPEGILCLTYTKAAAAQMATRIYELLGEWAVLDDAALRKELCDLTGRADLAAADFELARQLFARVLDLPGGLRIQTIHAFCESVLSRFPVEAGIPPGAAVMDERSASELLSDLRDRLLARALDKEGAVDPNLAIIARHVNERDFLTTLTELTKHRNRLHRALGRDGVHLEGAIAQLRRLLELRQDENEAAILANACRDEAFDKPGLTALAGALARGGKLDQEPAKKISAWLAATPEQRRSALAGYLDAFFTNKGDPRKSPRSKSVAEFFPQAADIVAAEVARLEALQEKRKALAVFEATSALLRFAHRLLGDYAREKALQGRLDYDDLIFLTRRLLSEEENGAAWVLFKLDGRLDHILVDEAQDTSPAQWDIVRALANEFFAGEGVRPDIRTVFAVGDIKQSIFGFQGADPVAFRDNRDWFNARVKAADRDWKTLGLEASFRSTKPILHAVNAVFARPAAQPGVTEGEAFPDHLLIRKGQAGLVELWPVFEPVESEAADDQAWVPPTRLVATDDPCERLADRIAATIARWLDPDNPEILESAARPVRPGDVLVLVRKRGNIFNAVVSALKRHGVPVAGSDRMVLTEELAVKDLIAAGRFALLPEDDLNLAILLRSPLMGLSEEALFVLAHDRGRKPLWRRLQEMAGSDTIFAAAYERLDALLGSADLVPPFEFFSNLLGPMGGRAQLAARLGAESHDPVDEFLARSLDHERLAPPSLEGFLHWLASATTEIKRDLEQGSDEVRIMTVHGAKGLQAPIVFLPDTCSVPNKNNDPKLFWRGGGTNDPPVWPGSTELEVPVSRAAREKYHARQADEYRRLLYVAMTRACDRLYVAGLKKASGKNRPRVPPGSWYELIEAGLEGLAEPVTLEMGRGLRLRAPQQAKPEKSDTGRARRPATLTPDWLARPAPADAPRARPLAPSRLSLAPAPPDSPLAAGEAGGRRPGRTAGEARFRRGTLIHRLLQILPDIGEADRINACHRFLSRPVHGLSQDEVNQITGEVMGVVDDPEFETLFGPGSRAEVPLTGTVGDHLVAGQVDRLVVSAEAVLVIDYKTQRPAPEAPQDVDPAYLKQMLLYRALLRDLYPRHCIRTALLWTETARALWLDDELLDQAGATITPDLPEGK